MYTLQKASLHKLGFFSPVYSFQQCDYRVKGAGESRLIEETMENLANKEQNAAPYRSKHSYFL